MYINPSLVDTGEAYVETKPYYYRRYRFVTDPRAQDVAKVLFMLFIGVPLLIVAFVFLAFFYLVSVLSAVSG